ncbi:MAG: hypothetical protein QHH15_02415 [Candidatus Thermoplasmatota archaeon]|jgi:hypothetical protein|nr:hypothetical protein [Candidatus Thermoplasmatota archaeon]
MENIYCVTLNKNNLSNFLTFQKENPGFIKEGEKLYILDLDGIEKNMPNLEFYQKISSLYDLWIDCGPRNIGDIVDIFMTGATSVTIRRQLFPLLNLSDIRDISENSVFLNIDHQYLDINDIFLKEFDGFVNFNSREEVEQDIRLHELIIRIIKQNKVYCYENNDKNFLFWKVLGVTGLLVEIDKLKVLKNGI